ncbi:caspase recruitment domain-containing protein 9-like, partial [Etheostoma cragini]|uniref:caspase recruitment domain-containing protein 9-like n=1 Tax=Etheostoma cragini TaxID=417921 RepID=UPI00155E0796
SRSLVLPTENRPPNRLEEKKEETQTDKEEKKEEIKEEKKDKKEEIKDKKEEIKEEKKDKKEEIKEELQQDQGPAQMNLLTSVFRLQRDLHRAEEQRTRSVEEKEELELLCAQLKGDARMYRQRNKQTLRQLEEVIRERDKALAARAEQQEEARLLLQEKDQYREAVRQLTEQSDRLELLLLSSQGAELQLRTRLRRLTCNTHQGERSSEEEEEPPESTAKGSSGTSGDNEAALQQHESPGGGAAQPEHQPSTDASWDEKTDGCLSSRSRPNFFYRRKRALRSKFTCRAFNSGNHDDSSGSDITDDSD